MIRVLVADDHPIVRNGIKGMLQREADIEVVGTATNGVEALEQVAALQPDILLLDIEMPGMGGVEVARQLQREGAPVKVLVLSAYNDLYYIQEVLQSGAVGYLTKDEVPSMILSAVRGVAAGEENWLSDKIRARLMRQQRSAKTDASLLSKREREVVNLVLEGLSEADIGRALSISDQTVARHMQMIQSKLGLHSKEEVTNALRSEQQ